MILTNWEFYSDSGNPLVGATVKVRDAVLTHPNTGTVLAATTTDSNGQWTVGGLSESAKDVEVIWGAANQWHKWYKGLTQHGVATITFVDPPRFVQQAVSPAAPGANASILFFKADGLPYYRSGASGVETRLAGPDMLRERLTANRTYYVRTDGSDSNTGLVDSAGGAFLTWQKAINTAASLDFNGWVVTLQHGAQAGTQTFTVGNTIPTLTGGGQLQIVGKDTLGNTFFNTSGANCFTVNSSVTQVLFKNLKLQSVSEPAGHIQINNLSTVLIGSGVIFGTASLAHVWVHDNQAQLLALNAAYAIVGSASYHIFVNGGRVFHEATTVSAGGTPNFSSGFVNVQNCGQIQSPNSTFPAAGVTGMRYFATMNGVINTFGHALGVNYFPGNAVGVTSAGGQYA